MLIRELPFGLLKQLGQRRGDCDRTVVGTREILTDETERGIFLVAKDGTYPELGKEFQVFPNRKHFESDEDPSLEIQVFGQMIKFDKENGDLYEDQVRFSNQSGFTVIPYRYEIMRVSAQIVERMIQLMEFPGFVYPRYRVKYESNQPVILPV